MPKRTLVYKGRTLVIETEGDDVRFQMDGKLVPVTSEMLEQCKQGFHSPYVSDSWLMDVAICLADHLEGSGLDG